MRKLDCAQGGHTSSPGPVNPENHMDTLPRCQTVQVVTLNDSHMSPSGSRSDWSRTVVPQTRRYAVHLPQLPDTLTVYCKGAASRAVPSPTVMRVFTPVIVCQCHVERLA